MFANGVDLYSEWKRWCVFSDGAKYAPAFSVIGGEDIAWDNPGNGDSFVFRTANKHALPSNFEVGEQVYLYYYTLNRDYLSYASPDYAYQDQISLKRSPLLTIINIEYSDTIEIVLGGNPLFTDNLENIEGGREIPIASYLVYPDAVDHRGFAIESASHAEGLGTMAAGFNTHAEGYETLAVGSNSHTEGHRSIANGDVSHAEGRDTEAYGYASHTEGDNTTAMGDFSHAEGDLTVAGGDYSHAEGNYTTVLSNSGHAEGLFTATVTGDFVRATAYIDNTLTGTVTGLSNLPSTFIVDAAPEIYLLTNTSGLTKVEGTFVITAADSSSITFTQSVGLPWTLPTEPDFSLIYLIVPNATAKGQQHAEGKLSIANGDSSHTEGLGTIATGSYSHAEGESTQAVGTGSHAEGQNTLALGDYSHAAGINSQAVEPHSFAFGAGVETADAAQTVLGTYNIPTVDAALVIGNGADALNLSNAITVGWDGKITSAASSINIALSSTPATSTSPGTTGDICWDADYIYVCIATDTWKRTALTTW